MAASYQAPEGEEIQGVPDTGLSWAAPVRTLKAVGIPAEAMNLNVDGRELTGPIHGFGQLWQKTYRIRLSKTEASPKEVIRVWKANFPRFWPKGNRFFGSMSGINPGDIAVLNLAGPKGITAPGGRPLISTGVMVIYADEESFSFMTPQGHMFAAMITFSAFEEQDTVVQIQALIRASDPIYEMSLRLGFGHRAEDEFWHGTLKNLAAYFGLEGDVEQINIRLDPRLQWKEVGNVRHNALIRTIAYLATSPFRRKASSG